LARAPESRDERRMSGWIDGATRPGDGHERRLARSSDPLTALCRMLDAARTESMVDAVAVADETGCLVAGAGAWQTCEELAAHAPLAANDVIPTRLDVLARRTRVRRLAVDGVEVLVSCQGGEEAAEAALARAAAGCQRILGRRRLR
jgi:hypothetical protein